MSQLTYRTSLSASVNVFAVWEFLVSSASGTFTIGESVSMGSAAGVVLNYLGTQTSPRIYVTVTGATMPVPGDALLGGTSGAAGNISSIEASSDFVTDVTVGDVFLADGDGTSYLVASISSPAKITLGASYGGAPDDYALSYVSTSFTTNQNLAYPDLTDRDPAVISKQMALTLDDALMVAGDTQVWTKAQHQQQQAQTHTVSGTLTVDLNLSTVHYIDLENDATLIDFTNKPTAGTIGTLIFEQGAGAPHAVTWTGLDFGAAGAPTEPTTLGDYFVVSFIVIPSGVVLATFGDFS
jgi:hypothetical protein